MMYFVLFEIFLFSLQPSKLDLDVFIAIGHVELDAKKYPNIVQWKKLVMSYSEVTQQRLHFIYFSFKLTVLTDFCHFNFSFLFSPFLSISSVPASLILSLSGSLILLLFLPNSPSPLPSLLCLLTSLSCPSSLPS